MSSATTGAVAAKVAIRRVSEVFFDAVSELAVNFKMEEEEEEQIEREKDVEKTVRESRGMLLAGFVSCWLVLQVLYALLYW